MLSEFRFLPLGYQQITPTSSTALTVPTGSTMAVFSAEVQGIRYRDDGTAPTTTVGFLIPVATIWEYSGNLALVRVINAVAGGILNVAYYKNPGFGERR